MFKCLVKNSDWFYFLKLFFCNKLFSFMKTRVNYYESVCAQFDLIIQTEILVTSQNTFLLA